MSSRTVCLWIVVMVTTFCCGVRAAPEAYNRRQGDSNILIPAATLQDLGLPENVLQDAKHTDGMAALVEILQQLHKTWQQQQGIDEDPNGQDSEALPVPESYSILPIPKALQTKFFRNQDGVIKDDTKRGSYMSLCHFKICNMGRKRNLHWIPWIRR